VGAEGFKRRRLSTASAVWLERGVLRMLWNTSNVNSSTFLAALLCVGDTQRESLGIHLFSQVKPSLSLRERFWASDFVQLGYYIWPSAC